MMTNEFRQHLTKLLGQELKVIPKAELHQHLEFFKGKVAKFTHTDPIERVICLGVCQGLLIALGFDWLEAREISGAWGSDATGPTFSGKQQFLNVFKKSADTKEVERQLAQYIREMMNYIALGISNRENVFSDNNNHYAMLYQGYCEGFLIALGFNVDGAYGVAHNWYRDVLRTEEEKQHV